MTAAVGTVSWSPGASPGSADARIPDTQRSLRAAATQPRCSGLSISLLGESSSQRVGIHEVRERPLPVDLDDGQVLSVARLELWLATDVDEFELEPELVLGAAHDLERTHAEVTVGRVIEADARYG